MRNTSLLASILGIAASVALTSGATARDNYEMDAPVTSIDAAAMTFVAGGVTIFVMPETRIEKANDQPAGFSDLVIGRDVEIDAVLTEQGWRAREIEIARKPLPVVGSRAKHGVDGLIDGVDLETRTITVGGVRVSIPESAKLEGDNDRRIRFEDLRVGDDVEIDGTFRDGVTLTARELERDEKD